MTHDEYIGLRKAMKRKRDAELISEEEYATLLAILEQAYQDNRPAADVEKEIGCDPGTLATDDAIIRLGKKFREIYGAAAGEMKTKLDEFLKKHIPELEELNRKAADGTITPEEARRLKGLIFRESILGQKADQLAGVVTNANRKAMAAVNGEMLGVFAENANWQSYQITQDAKMDLMFSVYDEHTAENLIRNNPKLLPPRKGVNGQKDQAWNKKMLAGTVAQAVIQGESIPKLARRIAADLGEKNSKAMMRYARTAMTGAQNSGRIEMLHRAESMGIKVKKRWLATLDSRTRDSHQHMDGVSVGVDEEFHTPLGSKMQYPGDVKGKGGDVWNCRCTLVYDYEGFPYDPTADVRRDNESSQVIANMSYDEWKEWKNKKSPYEMRSIAGETWGETLGRGKVKGGVFTRQEEKIVNDFIKNMPEPFAREYRGLYNTVTVTHDPNLPTSWDHTRNVINFNPNTEFTEKTVIHEGAHWFDDHFSFDDTIELKGRRRKRDANGNVMRDRDGKVIYEDYTEALQQHYSSLSAWMNDKYTADLREQDYDNMLKFFGIDNAVDSGEKFASFLSWWHKNENIPYVGVITDIAYGMMPEENWMELISGVELHNQQYWNDGMNLFRESFANFSEVTLSQEIEITKMFEKMAPNLYHITRKGFIKLWKSK